MNKSVLDRLRSMIMEENIYTEPNLNEKFNNLATSHFEYLYANIRKINDLRERKKAFIYAGDLTSNLFECIIVPSRLYREFTPDFMYESFRNNRRYFYTKAVNNDVLIKVQDNSEPAFPSTEYNISESYSNFDSNLSGDEAIESVVGNLFAEEIKDRAAIEFQEIHDCISGFRETLIDLYSIVVDELSCIDFTIDSFIDCDILKNTTKDLKQDSIETYIKKDKDKVYRYLLNNIPGKMAKPVAIIIFALHRLGYLDLSNLSAIYRSLTNATPLAFTIQSLQSYIGYKNPPSIAPQNGTGAALFEEYITAEQQNIISTLSKL